MKQLLLLLFLFVITVAKPTEPFEYEFNNAIQFHPLFPAGIPLELYIGEIDYLRTNEKDLSLLIRLRGEYNNFWLGLDDYAGFQSTFELETGVRKTFMVAGNRRVEFGLYVQGTMFNGGQNFYKEYYVDSLEYEKVIDSIVTVKGYSGGFNLGGGLHFQRKRFIMNLDLCVGPHFNVPEKKKVSFGGKPNFTIGFLF